MAGTRWPSCFAWRAAPLGAAGPRLVTAALGRAEVELLTDRLAAGPWRALGPQKTGRLAELLFPLVMSAVDAGILPSQSTLGIGRNG